MRINQQQLPGIMSVIAVSILAMVIYSAVPFFHMLGAEALALLLGIGLGNTVLQSPTYSPGISWSEKYPIEIAIALLGFSVSWQALQQLGLSSVVFIVLQMVGTILLVLWLGWRVFKVDRNSGLLMAIGNAVCGNSAIGALTPVIQAQDNQRRYAVATASLTGVGLLFILPSLAPYLFGDHSVQVGAMIGGTMQSVGQVVGAGTLVSEQVTVDATLFKMLRIVLLVVAVAALARLARIDSTPSAQTKVKVTIVPWFIAVFIGLLVVQFVVTIPQPIAHTSARISHFLGIMNLAAIGLHLRWATLRASGLRFAGYGLAVGIGQVILAWGLIRWIL
jgi:uncharacterized integral membrane protein (TIGR00698 family)